MATRFILAACCLFLLTTSAAADPSERHWPSWRGPALTGVSPKGDPPVRWSESENVRVKVSIPGRSLSSPVVWGDHVFVMTAISIDDTAYAASQEAAAEVLERGEWPPKVLPVKQRFVLIAFSRKDGKILWQRVAAERVPHESHYIDSSWSCASPVTDGERVFAHFGSNGTYAYDMKGTLLWETDLGDMTTRRGFGEGSSPALLGDTLVINWDHEGNSFLIALDATNGEPRWKTERPDEVTSWSTPLIVEHGDRPQIVIASTGRSRGYDLETGRELWSLAGMTVNTIPTPVHLDGTVYLTSGYRGTMLQAVDLSRAKGELEGTDAVVWTHERDTPYVASPLLYDDTLYFIKHVKNILSVLDARSGKPRFEVSRLTGLGDVWSSPVGAAGRVYIFDRDGKTRVLRHGSKLEVLAENQLDGIVDSTPAIVDDEIIVQTREHLYILAKPAPEN